MENPQRVIVVGDVHGCLVELKALLARVRFNPFNPFNDRLILAGDLVDRGPDSHFTVTYALDIGAEMVMGNHDEKHLRYRKHVAKKALNPTYKIPMTLNERAMKVQKSLTDDAIEYLAKAPPFIRFPWGNREVIVVHGGLQPGKHPEQQDPKIIVRLRYVHKDTHKPLPLGPGHSEPLNGVYWTSLWDGPELVVYGHNVGSLDHSIRTHNEDGSLATIGLDTGACFGGHLTAAVFYPLGRAEVVSVKATSNTLTYDDWKRKFPGED